MPRTAQDHRRKAKAAEERARRSTRHVRLPSPDKAPSTASPHLASYTPSDFSCVATWLQYNAYAQDARVRNCTLSDLESSLRHLSDLTQRSQSALVYESKYALATKIGDIFRSTLHLLATGAANVRSTRFSLPIIRDGTAFTMSEPQLISSLESAFGTDIFHSLTDVHFNKKAPPPTRETVPRVRQQIRTVARPRSPPIPRIRKRISQKNNEYETATSWPTRVSTDVKRKCVIDYIRNTTWVRPSACAVCDRDRPNASLFSYDLDAAGRLPATFQQFLAIPAHSRFFGQEEFLFAHQGVDNLMLSRKGVHTTHNGHIRVDVCRDCLSCLAPSRSSSTKASLPKYSLANKLYLGALPERFCDLTWVEEQACALHRSTVFVYRLYHSDNPQDPYVAKGNSCAHPQNTVSTARILPRTPANVAGCISVLFTGANADVSSASLKKVFRVRRDVVHDFLQWLRVNNPLYSDIEVSDDNLALYGDHGSDEALPGIADRVITNASGDADALFNAESAGFESHPAMPNQTSEPASSDHIREHMPATDKPVFLEHTGVYDPDNTMMPSRNALASGLRNFKRPNGLPDLIIPKGSDAIPEYGNPKLFPGMFPTLFPLGIGGFDDETRETRLSFQKHVEYLLDISDRRFRYHRSFIFVALNIHQRRTAHLHTWLTVKKSRFESIAPVLATLSSDRLNRVAKHLECNGKLGDLSEEDQAVMTLMKEVSSISGNIPGSSAAKLRVRNEIRAYMGYFGLPHLYLTLNPNATHSPIFHAMWGDDKVDLSLRNPILPESSVRGQRVASDPVAGADFFEFSIERFFEDLLGWDYATGSSKKDGGILGKVRAYYGTAEFTDRGQLHGHFLIWLDGGLNPSEVHARMRDPKMEPWKKDFFSFFDDIIAQAPGPRLSSRYTRSPYIGVHASQRTRT